jgi:hypothetical protein
MISAGIIGYSELLPSDVTEYCVWDIDAIEVVEALPCKPASKNPLAQSGNRARMISGGVGMKKQFSGGGWRKSVSTDKTEKPFVAYHLDKDGKQCWYACDTMSEARSVAAGGPDKRQPTCRCEQVGHYTTTCKVHGTPALKPVANPAKGRPVKADYRWLVVSPSGQVLAGNEYQSDAKDALAELSPAARAGAKVMARATYIRQFGAPRWATKVPNPGGKKGFAVVQHRGMEEVVLSVHSTQAAAQSAMRVKEGKSGRMDLRVQAFGPGTGRELVTGMDGGRFLRHTLARNPAKRAAPRGPAAVAAGKRVLGLKVGDIVCYKASHLKSLHWFTNVPINGKITKLEGDKHAHLYPDRVGEDLSAAYVATVKWHDRTPSRVLCSNLIKYSERHRELP